ncbi:hypothetical protein C0989_003002 [Termitomyces sp. Mn162]|nr:hypothetical protein C0989_003002 [Termitomyces sp. Mn162]
MEVDAPMFAFASTSEVYKPVVEFDQQVTVYDSHSETGRPFHFQPANFDVFPSWQAYKKNNAELPEKSVVTIEFTVDLYEARGHKFLTLNILFVILLHDLTYVMGLSEPISIGDFPVEGVSAGKLAKGKGKACK